jgi:hypothetical protein
MELCPFFLAKKKGPKKTRLAGGLRSHAARLYFQLYEIKDGSGWVV